MGKMENEKNIEIIWLKITHLENDIANEEWTEDPANLFLQKMWLRSNDFRPVTTCIKIQKQRIFVSQVTNGFTECKMLWMINRPGHQTRKDPA